MTHALLLAALAGPARAAWSVRASSAPAVASEAFVLVAGAPAGLAADKTASSTPELAVVNAEEKDGVWGWTVLPLSTGTIRFTARYRGADGAAVEAPEVALSVAPPTLPPDADIVDIRPPLKGRAALWPWALALLLAAAAWASRRYWQQRAALALPGAPPVPPQTPDDAARTAIAELQSSGLWPRDPHAYYLRLTEILRVYLERRYDVPATAMTSVEAARLVKSRVDDLRVSATVRELLSRADLVKFARVAPAADEGPRDAGLALAVIKATTPQDLAAAPEEAPAR